LWRSATRSLVPDLPPDISLIIASLRSRAVQTAIVLVAIGILSIVAYGDVRTRCIPNLLTAAIAILGTMRMVLVHDPVAASQTVAAGTAVFAAAFLAFSRGVVGGGDAKLVAATALLIGYHDLFGFLLLMSLFGGALALAILARDRIRHQPLILSCPGRISSTMQAGGDSMAAAPSTVPYGVAIAVGGVITLILEMSSMR
jgi:prepilin peptidase CpaA